MENAVKALLIAAAVIIAVLIITLVMGVFDSGAEQVGNNSDLTEYQIKQFNDKFIKYEGTNKNALEVNAMIKAVFNHNNQQEDISTMVEIEDNRTGVPAADKVSIVPAVPTQGAVTTSPKTVKTGQTYKVTATYENNLINKLTIE